MMIMVLFNIKVVNKYYMKLISLIFFCFYSIMSYSQKSDSIWINYFDYLCEKDKNYYYIIDDSEYQITYHFGVVGRVIQSDTLSINYVNLKRDDVCFSNFKGLLNLQNFINQEFIREYVTSESRYDFIYFSKPMETSEYLNLQVNGCSNQTIFIPTYHFKFKNGKLRVKFVINKFVFKSGKLKKVKIHSVLAKWKGQLNYLKELSNEGDTQ